MGVTMKRFMLALAPLLLAGCGNTRDFTVEVDRTSEAVMAELASIEGAELALFGIKPFTHKKDDDGTLHFFIPAEKGYKDGEVIFWVADAGGGKTRVDVSVDLPQITRGDKVLSDSRAEEALEEEMRSWAEEFGQGKSAKLGIQGALAGFAIASQDFSATQDPEAFLARAAGRWGSSDYFDFADEGDGFDPETSNTEFGEASDFGRPMDSARGSSSYPSADYEDTTSYDESGDGESDNGGWGDGTQ